MSRAVYTCPIIGTGQDEDAYRPLIADLLESGGWSACIGSYLTGRDRGKPRFGWTIVRVEADKLPEHPDLILLSETDEREALEATIPTSIRNSLRMSFQGERLSQIASDLFKQHYPTQSPDLFLAQAAGLPLIRGGDLVPGILISDTFTDTNGTLLQNHTPEIGDAWEPLNFRAQFTDASSVNARITSDGALESASSPNASRAYRNSLIPLTAQYNLSLHMRTPATSASSTHVLLARMSETGVTSSAVDRYMFRAGFGLSALFMAKIISGSFTALAQSGNVGNPETEYDMAFDVSDAVKEGTVTGVASISTEDNDIAQVGRVGLGTSKNDGQTGWLDNFLAEGDIFLSTVDLQARRNQAVDLQGRRNQSVDLRGRRTSTVDLEATQ